MQNICMTYGERKKHIGELSERVPDIEVSLVARSILSRDIDSMKIGEGNMHIVAVGAHHGMEYITSAALFDFVEFLADKFTRNASFCGVDIKFLLQKFTFWIVPCLNPDGVELCLTSSPQGPLRERQLKMNGSTDFSAWQANARGVDLNHNYNYRFAEYKKLELERDIMAGRSLFSGEYPESEPETKGLAGFIRALAPSLVVSLHTQGRELYSMPESEYMSRVSAKAASAAHLKFTKPEDTAKYGGLTDYCGGVLGIPSFTAELGRGSNPLPASEFPSICDSVRRLLILLPTYL